MPATRFSVLEIKPETELRPGETHIRLKDDPYYGKVDVGPSKDEANKEWEQKERERIGALPADQKPAAEAQFNRELAKRKGVREGEVTGPVDEETLAALEQAIKDGAHALDGEEQNHVEVMTGRRLQQKQVEARPPEADVPADDAGVLSTKAEKKPEAKAPAAAKA